MKSIPHKSRTRFLAHNPTGELMRVISHQFTTANPNGGVTRLVDTIKKKIGVND